MEGVPFSFFCSLVQEISLNNARRTTSSTPVDIFQRWTQEAIRLYPSSCAHATSIIFDLLFPSDDVNRTYGIQETKLARYISRALGVDAASLLNWDSEGSSGVLGVETKKIMQQHHTLESSQSSLTVTEINEALDELASHCDFSHISIRRRFPSTTRRSRLVILQSLYRELHHNDGAILTQIILKDLRPILYPVVADHFTVALRCYNTSSVKILARGSALSLWNRLIYVPTTAPGHSVRDFSDVSLGKPIEIPKSQKARNCKHALGFFVGSRELWAETKYDGERAQIHVEMLPDHPPKITIFSKSKRDSTFDRWGIHPLIHDALCLSSPASRKIKTNAILDAEMVAMHDDEIDEFWRLRSLIEQSARGPRARPMNPPRSPNKTQNHQSQGSIVTDTSEARYLGLVFFDILLLDSRVLLGEAYSSRRALLESLIRRVPGKVMIASRFLINLEDQDVALSSLHEIFADHIANHQEGLVIKAAESRYNDRRWPWVKLKKDYIPGYGDTLDLLIVGAGWDKDRARELLVGPSVFTTFYVGSFETLNQPEGEDRRPARLHLHVYFTVSYGLDRNQLEEVNFLIKNSDHRPFGVVSKFLDSTLPYTLSTYQGIKPPAILLSQPLLVELFGAGFTKSPGSGHYELRFPRITKVYRAIERSWLEAVNLHDLHRIALECIGRDRSVKEVDDWCNSLWGKPTSPSAKSVLKRKRTAERWQLKLARLDGTLRQCRTCPK
ncbi:DNA ligase/mRNA capping enzyme [Pluteus cervinus]|uniref:DNA ligase/mRNA capping enzyme n=1 Tax=Pluteus cervinus TaxID=181527 RepID=A0ACD3B025_9AGAR|nr:DNA ligase/mRNA capping enzyme [Pluteus cervinus]